jgi:transcriptional regulator with XRE-family HTH domain
MAAEGKNMPPNPNKLADLVAIGRCLAAARHQKGWTQAELARRARLQRQHIVFFETGKRIPGLRQLLAIAGALDLPLQRFLTGNDRPGQEVRDIAIELRHLGLVDLWVEKPVVPGAFRAPEEVVALALAGERPEARIVEGLPAVLAWNRWNPLLLRAHARSAGPKIVHRLAWLAEVALTLERLGGFPGGCAGKTTLEAFVRKVPKPAHDGWDDLGSPGREPPSSAVWKRWKISYGADLTAFRERAATLASLTEVEG